MSKTVIDTVSLICMIGLAALILTTVIVFFRKSREGQYAFLKSFKRGSCVLVCFTAVPLYILAGLHGGMDFLTAFLTSLKSGFSLIVLEFGIDKLQPLFGVSRLFQITCYVTFFTVILNAVVFVFAVAGLNLLNRHYRRRAFWQKDRIYIIFGFCQENFYIVRSIREKKQRALLVIDEAAGGSKDEIQSFLYTHGTAVVRYTEAERKAIFQKLVKYREKKAIHIIVNTGDDKKNLLLVKELSALISAENLVNDSLAGAAGIHVHAYCQPEDVSAFTPFVERSLGHISVINKYRQVAIDLIGRYPLTQSFKEEIDPTLPVLAEDVTVNVILLGFGKTCKQIFETAVSTQSFVTLADGNFAEKQVHYYAYDKADSSAEANFNHGFCRYKSFLDEHRADVDGYLPFADCPKFHFEKMSTFDSGFYASLREHIKGKKTYNTVVISFGTDMENLNLAQKLTDKLSEWGLLAHTRVFVKVRDKDFFQKIMLDEANFGKYIIPFGGEGADLYHIDRIVNEKLYNMAKCRHISYIAEGRQGKSREEILEVAMKKWYAEGTVAQRDANVYACLALRANLNLLGFDITDKKTDDSRAVAAFYERYQKGYPFGEGVTLSDGRVSVSYCNADIDRPSVRHAFAVIEHQRWNAGYICRGFVPASVDEIRDNPDTNGKSFALRRHGCLTTFEGLKKFRALTAKIGNMSLEAADVIRYDFQLMDAAVWLLHRNGCYLIDQYPTDQ